MDIPCGKLAKAIGGAPFLGYHTFGEQGKFPDGSSGHGNLMFSVCVFSNRRKVRVATNSDTGKTITSLDAQWHTTKIVNKRNSVAPSFTSTSQTISMATNRTGITNSTGQSNE
jgi:hypothetical protein